MKSGSVDGVDDASMKNNVIVRGVLSVTVIAAEDLPAADLMGKADPFVVLMMKKSETKAKTRVTFRVLENYSKHFILGMISFVDNCICSHRF